MYFDYQTAPTDATYSHKYKGTENTYSKTYANTELETVEHFYIQTEIFVKKQHDRMRISITRY